MAVQLRSETEKLEALIRELPSDLIPEAEDFLEFLLEKHAGRPRQATVEPKQKYIGLSWVGGLSELRDQYTSLELERKAVYEWRGD